MNVVTKFLTIIPIVAIGFVATGGNPMTNSYDPGFKCENGGLVVISVKNQTTRAIAEKYCTGDVEKANQALIERYEGTTIPHWAFIDVESLGKR
jgi:hypothetical protein